MLPPFEIFIKIPVPKKIKMVCEQYYASNQVERYKLKYGSKEIRIEKKLNSRQPWKILGANYEGFKPTDFAAYIHDIAIQIDNENAPPETPYIHPKNIGY